jgi:hypothetical protein
VSTIEPPTRRTTGGVHLGLDGDPISVFRVDAGVGDLPTGLLVTLCGLDGQTSVVDGRDAVAADGAASGIRAQLGLTLIDDVSDEPWSPDVLERARSGNATSASSASERSASRWCGNARGLRGRRVAAWSVAARAEPVECQSNDNRDHCDVDR